MTKNIKNNQGFSLVELMIVVAIIGILSAIAIPNFQRFQRKARQSEAKNMLSAFYTAEKAFIAEYNQSAGNFLADGFQPDGRLGFRVVTAQNGANPFTAMNMVPAPVGCTSTVIPSSCPNAGWLENPAGASGKVGPDTGTAAPAPAANQNFQANAGGWIGGTTADHWQIDQTMLMQNTQSGL